jgi:hypothetical protein
MTDDEKKMVINLTKYCVGVCIRYSDWRAYYADTNTTDQFGNRLLFWDKDKIIPLGHLQIRIHKDDNWSDNISFEDASRWLNLQAFC